MIEGDKSGEVVFWSSCWGPSPLYAYQAPIAPSEDTNMIGIFGRRICNGRGGADDVLYLLTTEEQERGFKPFSLVLRRDRLVFAFRI